MEPVRTSAPGKLILMGEHAVVYGQPALIAAVDRRLHARVQPAGVSGSVEIRLPQIGVATHAEWGELAAYARQAREAWKRYAEAPGSETFAAMRGKDPAHLARVALGEAASFLGTFDGPGMRLEVASQLPIGSGFGSSAALAVAVLAAVLTARTEERPSLEDLERLALEVERRQHGLPSGVDGATVLHGGLVWAERNEERKLATEPLDPGGEGTSDPLERFRVLDTGSPREATGTVVAAVRERLEEDPGLRDAVRDVGELTVRFRQQLGVDSLQPLIATVREVEARLEALGVVPEPVRELVRKIEEEGGAAKISGAGALTSPAQDDSDSPLGAGSLLVLHPEPEEISGWAFLQERGLDPLPLRLGAEGLRWEE